MKSILKKGYHVYFIKTIVETSVKIALKHSNSVTARKKKNKTYCRNWLWTRHHPIKGWDKKVIK